MKITTSDKYTAKQILRWLWQAWRGNRLQAALNALLGVADVVLSLAQVWAVKHAIDVASGSDRGSIHWAVGIMGALILLNFAVNISGVWVRNLLGVRAQNRMQQATLRRILQSEWHSREHFHSGDVLNRLELDVSNVVTFLTETLPSTLSTVLMFVGAFACMYLMDSTLALILVVMIPLFVLVSKVYMRRMRRLSRRVRESDSKVQSSMQESVQHRMVVKTLEATQTMVERLEATQSELRQNVVNRTKFSVLSNFILNFGFASGYLLAFLWAAVRMQAGTLTFGGMTAFLQLVNRIQSPARTLTKLVPAFVSVFTAAERLMELEEEPREPEGEPIRFADSCGIRLENVTYRYEDGTRDIIKNLSFDFRPGSTTAILGETGAGKTTLVRMLLALMRPKSGHIYMYDADGEKELTPLMRCNFVYVPQGNTLLSGTIRENLLLGDATATDEMKLEEEPREPEGEPIRFADSCGIRLENVTYRYEDGTRDIIKNLSFDFRPGSTTAILGETGAGKTTLVRMLLALMRPKSGHIYMYDADGEKELTPLMRCNFVYVPQGNTLLSGTIRENLLLGDATATDEMMREALRKSCAEFVFNLPDGLDTHCSECGGGLSEGQAQRIAIARALLRNRAVLVFDEATSALDSETECRLLRNILDNDTHTVIFITHRPAVLEYCSQQLVI